MIVMGLHRFARWLGLPHWYVSTGCLHGGTGHAYCQSNTGSSGTKRAGRCKFCDARCRCSCHRAEVHRVDVPAIWPTR